jgi:hypothetical protein
MLETNPEWPGEREQVDPAMGLVGCGENGAYSVRIRSEPNPSPRDSAECRQRRFRLIDYLSIIAKGRCAGWADHSLLHAALMC